ncbi:MAG TPA: hypothetical protein PKE32_08070 [Miltoncostaeaceae bacterium]|nr:hypothetical protein [Miltoncostaeaceae bacterium]
MRPPHRFLLLLIGILSVGGLLTGCGGDSSSPPDRTANMSPREILAASADAYRDLGAFRGEFTLTGNASLGPRVDRRLGGAIDVKGEGLVRPPSQTAVDLSVKGADWPIRVQAGLTRDGDRVALSAMGKDVGLEIDRRTLAFLDFAGAYPELTRWIARPTVAPGETIDGSTTVLSRGEIDRRRVRTALAPLLGEASDARALAGFTGQIHLTIGTADLLPRAVELTLRAPAAHPGAAPSAVTFTGELRDFNTDDRVVMPEVDRTVPLDQLPSAFGL